MDRVSLSKKVVVGVLITGTLAIVSFCYMRDMRLCDAIVSTYSKICKKASCNSVVQSLQVETIWGTQTITDPCAIELINTSLMQRLHHIDQSGPQSYFGIEPDGRSLIVPHFSRFDHSVGVYLLLIKAGVSHHEQIAGLMHDASHTVFSHVGDMVFGKGDGVKSYQDGIHIDYLRSYDDVQKVLKRYDIALEDMDPDKEEYTALERPLPDLCADRIQYIIHTGVILECITREQAKQIVDDLEFKNGIWFFKNIDTAYMFASISLHCLEALWGGEVNAFFYLIFKHMLLRAIDLKLLTSHDLHYSIDQKVLDILLTSDDHYIKRLLSYTDKWDDWYKVVLYEESPINYRIKFRGVNPYVLVNEKLERLTDIHPEYSERYNERKEWCRKGYGLQLMFNLDV